jgi:hypothetical protein
MWQAIDMARHKSFAIANVNALLLLLVGLGIIPLTSGQQFWWLAPLIAGVGVISIVWFNYGERKLREWRMRKPYSVCFKLGRVDGL